MNRESNQTQSMKSVRSFEKVSQKIKEMIFKGVMNWLIARVVLMA